LNQHFLILISGWLPIGLLTSRLETNLGLNVLNASD